MYTPGLVSHAQKCVYGVSLREGRKEGERGSISAKTRVEELPQIDTIRHYTPSVKSLVGRRPDTRYPACTIIRKRIVNHFLACISGNYCTRRTRQPRSRRCLLYLPAKESIDVKGSWVVFRRARSLNGPSRTVPKVSWESPGHRELVQITDYQGERVKLGR